MKPFVAWTVLLGLLVPTVRAAEVQISQDSTPLVLFVGQVATSMLGRGAFQEVLPSTTDFAHEQTSCLGVHGPSGIGDVRLHPSSRLVGLGATHGSSWQTLHAT